MPALSSIWGAPVRLASIASVAAYIRVAYRIRRWGRLPIHRGPTLVIANHQHDLDDMAIIAQLTLDGPVRDPIFTVSSRRQFEPGFLAVRLPWLGPLLRHYNPGPLFEVIGMRPIENQLATRAVANLAWMLHARHSKLHFRDLFHEATLQRLGIEDTRVSDVFSARWFARLQMNAKLSELREPYRTEAIEMTRAQIDADLSSVEGLLKSGATLYLAPEGRHTLDGHMGRFRGAFTRLAPLAQLYVVAMSYDPFLGNRLSALYRVLRCDSPEQVEAVLRAARPVTISQLLAEWIAAAGPSFSQQDAISAIRLRLESLPPALFVDPELRERPAAITRAALTKMTRLGLLRSEGSRFVLTQKRYHPSFAEVHDILAYQVNFLGETLAAVKRLDADLVPT
ncbi:MAG: hypothetical protein ABI182_00900 [Candidatus Baltobacteraceae bacterium]